MALSSNFMNSNYGILSNATVPSLSNLIGSLAFAQDASGNIYSGMSGRSIIKISTSLVQTTVTSNLPAQVVGLAYTGGYLYASTYGNYTILKYDLAGNLVQTIGSTEGYVDGNASTAKFNSRWSNKFTLTADESGNVYAGDSGNKLIRKIDSSGNVTTVAGTLNSTTIVDGIGSAASFNKMLNIQYNRNTLYVIDSYDLLYSYTILRKISLPSYTVTSTSNRVSPVNSALTFDTNGNIYTNDMLGQFVQINTRPVSTSFHQQSIAYNGNMYVAAGFDGVDYSATIATSKDLFSWYQLQADPFAGAYPAVGRGIVWNGSYFLAVGTNSNSSKTIAKSVDGSNWTVSTDNPFAGRGGNGVAWNGTYWIAVGANSNRSITIARSTDGLNWTPSTTSPFTAGSGNGITWAGSFWVAIGNNSDATITIAKSTDGSNWTPSINNPFLGEVGNCVVWNGSYILAGGKNAVRDGPTCIAKSTDGMNWTGFSNTMFTATTGGGEGYAFGWNGTYWVAAGSKQVGGGVVGTIGISSNGVNWTESITTEPPGAYYGRFVSVLWNSINSTWYVGCQGAVGLQRGATYGGGILASKDGLNWSISPTYSLIPDTRISSAIFNAYTSNIHYINLNTTSNYGILSWTANAEDTCLTCSTCPAGTVANETLTQNTVYAPGSSPSYIKLSGPQCVTVGSIFTVLATGDWASASGAVWRFNGAINSGCLNPGCGFIAPSTPGTSIVTYTLNGVVGTLNIQVVAIPIQIQNTVYAPGSSPSYITLSGPKCVTAGSIFTVLATGDWISASGAIWRLNGAINSGCRNPGCGFIAPSNAGTAIVTYTLNGVIGTLNIQVVVCTTVPSITQAGGVVGSAGGSAATVQFASATTNPIANGLIFSKKDASGNTFVIDGQRIRKMDINRNYTEVAGVYNTTGNTNGPGASALFNNPGGIAIDRSGNIYVADTGNYVIRKIDSSYNVTTVAGTQGVSGVVNAAGTSARFRSPQKMVTDGSIALYVVDVGAGAGNTNIIRKVSLSTYSVANFALYSIGILLAIDSTGNLYTNGSIIQIDSTGQATVFALTSASPTSIATDDSGNVYYGTYDSTASTSSVTVLNSTGVVVAAYGPIPGSTGNISVDPATGTVSLFSPGTVTLTTIAIGSFTVINTAPPCFLEGTRIRCFVNDIEQYIPIESLKPGMLVQTIANGYMAIDTIGHSKIYNPGNDARSKHRLYKCSRKDYIGMNSDLYMTGCHSILVDTLMEEEEKNIIDDYGKIYTTDRKYRLPTYLDLRAKPWNSEGLYTIWHLALENSDYYMNYGIYANGLVVETTSKRYMKELSGMTLV